MRAGISALRGNLRGCRLNFFMVMVRLSQGGDLGRDLVLTRKDIRKAFRKVMIVNRFLMIYLKKKAIHPNKKVKSTTI